MQTAYKIWIGSILGGNMIFNGDKFIAVDVSNKSISKVNFIANVIETYANNEKHFTSVTLDDGSGQIRVKGFSDSSFLLDGINMGETICVIGWLRYFNNELYMIPEIVRRVDSKWALIRRLELIKLFGDPSQTKTNTPESNEEKFEVKSEKLDDTRQVILSMIKKNDEGMDIEKLIMETNFPVEKINSILNSLMEAGDIYEPMPGRLRAM
jgi:RPA family protein